VREVEKEEIRNQKFETSEAGAFEENPQNALVSRAKYFELNRFF